MLDFKLLKLSLSEAAEHKTDALVLLLPKDFKPEEGDLSAWIRQAQKNGDLKNKAGSILAAYAVPQVKSPRLVLASTGSGKAEQVRKAVLAALRHVRQSPAKNVTLCFAQQTGSVVKPAVMAVADALYSYDTTKTKESRDKNRHDLRVCTMVLPSVSPDDELELEQAVAMASGVEFAKEWANRPGNHATPSLLAKAAQSLTKDENSGIQCEVLGPREVAKLGMGAFQAVAQGSSEALRFIILRYQGAAADDAPIALVGKGITFDSGGISIKPSAQMDEMKFDMGGAASVLGVFRALADLRPEINVVGLIASCENMPGPGAVKPGDVVTSMSGQSIEVLNTDAEGRLVLCDALEYAKRFKPRSIIDMATLTGACVVALGHVRSGLFSPHDDLASDLAQAGEQALDPCWRMPLDNEYGKGLQSNFADVANVAGRDAGAITAAKFLQRFVKDQHWAHLDIAGTAWQSGKAKGATGRPVALLLHYLLQQAGT